MIAIMMRIMMMIIPFFLLLPFTLADWWESCVDELLATQQLILMYVLHVHKDALL